ncbi:hypothetical protein ACFWNL_38815 [Kitasatospora sp. NPDC058397]|uniref:hypothetical protein n=1 Tax=unclassified Kitasatospora TaxID=2633591 RepID=UPI0036565D45
MITVGAQPAAETALAPPGEPIYAELAAAWRVMGKTVPGQPDPLWDILVAGDTGRYR